LFVNELGSSGSPFGFMCFVIDQLWIQENPLGAV
jgi:hypothetical protein